MKLHQSKAYSRGGSDYCSRKVNIPREDVATPGWEHGTDWGSVVCKDGLLLRPAKAKRG